jgi:nucleoside-diphosphate-sugar epimerase
MRVVITGGGGVVGLALARALLKRGQLTGPDGEEHEIDELVLFDLNPPREQDPAPVDSRVSFRTGDISELADVRGVIDRPDISVFHLAGIFSAGCERDFDLAMRVNFDGTRNVLEACRALGSRPRVVFSSSGAVYGDLAVTEVATDRTKLIPQLTYGMTKVVGELLINDYSRRKFVDGRGIRLSSVVIRPDESQPGFFMFVNSMFPARLNGQKVVIPVGADSVFRVSGYRTTAKCLIALHELDGARLRNDRIVNIPQLYVTVRDLIDSLDRVAGDRPLGPVEIRPDADIEAHMNAIPRAISGDRARVLGLPQDASIDDVVREYLEDYVDVAQPVSGSV